MKYDPKEFYRAHLAKDTIPLSKIASIKNLAHEIVNKNLVLDGTADFAETCKKLLAIKGIGSWSVAYVAMRALRDPDSFPETDLELQKNIIHFGFNLAKWALWRAYATILLSAIKI